MEPKANRKQRRAAPEPEKLDTEGFVKLADRFVDVANRANRKALATDVHMAFLYAAARYNAHVARTSARSATMRLSSRRWPASTRTCCATTSPTRRCEPSVAVN